MHKKIMPFVILYGSFIFNISFAEKHDSFYSLPSGLPPPVDNSCPKHGPGKITRSNCLNFEWMLKKYLNDEGPENRGLRFYQAFLLLDSKSKDQKNIYPFDMTKIFGYFGNPSYKRSIEFDGEQINQYAYLFSYLSNKDWACIVSFNDSGIKSIGYSETTDMILGGWSKYD